MKRKGAVFLRKRVIVFYILVHMLIDDIGIMVQFNSAGTVVEVDAYML